MKITRSARSRGAVVWLGVFWAAFASGCLSRDLSPLTPCTVSGVAETIRVNSVDKVDLLFMIDNSNSMTEEQASLAAELPRLVGVLASGDLQFDPSTGMGDGVEDFPPVKDLHVGVVSSDMGVGGLPDFVDPACADEPVFGDDGVLQIEGCGQNFGPPNFLSFVPGSPPDPSRVDDFAQDFQCVAQLGVTGCNFEQQFEAALKAITPSSSDITFFQGSSGHGDAANDGFLRPDSLLGVFLLTDEDDCSWEDVNILDQDDTSFGPAEKFNIRCALFPGALRSIDRYVDGFLESRRSPDLLVFAAITGVPLDLVGEDYQTILNDPALVPVEDPLIGNQLQPACEVEGRGKADPPRRIVTLAQRLEQAGANSVLQSICQEDFRPALDAIIAKIAEVLQTPCLPRDLNRDRGGLVNCNVLEVLPATGDLTSCDQLASAGRSLERIENGQQVCRVAQVPVRGSTPEPGQLGWFYDDFSSNVVDNCGADGQRIEFTSGAEPRTGVVVRLECLQGVQVTELEDGTATIGTRCTPGTDGDALCGGSRLVSNMICDPDTGTCQRTCTSNADCAFLGSYICGTDLDTPLCVNPICPQG